MAFGRGGHIAVAFLTQEMGGRRQSVLTIEASRKLHLVSLDAATGRIIANQTWPDPSATLNNTYVGANRDGNFVLLRGNTVKVYSPELQEMGGLEIPVDPAGSHNDWSLLVSPGGDFAFLLHHLKGGSDLRMLSATTLREICSWDKSEEIELAFDKYLAMRRADGLYVRALDTPWRRIADLTCSRKWPPARVAFVSEDSLIVSNCGRVQLLRVDGQVLFTTQLPNGHPLSDSWGSPNGRFVAVAADKMTGVTMETLDMYRHPAPWRILVYDSKNGSLVSTLKFTWQFTCAFSPDSSGLALLSGGIIEMFSLPQPSR
jgi:hypothetical protein